MKISIVSIATNGYIQYWLKMQKSFVENMSSIEEVEFHILTDDPELARSQFFFGQGVSLVVHEIPSEPWPLPTLLRYKHISGVLDLIHSGYFMYIDADMILHSEFDLDIPEIIMKNEINFVAHPGFWRSSRRGLNRFQVSNLPSFFKDFIRRLRLGALGDWETRKYSKAYVPRKLRNTYICGGIWFGPTNKLSLLVRELSERTQLDLDDGIVAKWHDESHLNSWYSRNSGNVLLPEYCFDPTYTNLRGLRPLIEAVDKGEIKRV